MSSKRVLIVGGVAGGASCAARLRRMDERAEIFMFERTGDVSVRQLRPAVLRRRRDRRPKEPAGGHARAVPRFLQHRSPHAARGAAASIAKTRPSKSRTSATGAVSVEPYDALVLATGAAPVRPPLPGIDLPGIFAVRNMDDVDQIHAWIDHRRSRAGGGGRRRLHRAGNGREPQPPRHQRHAAGDGRSGDAAGRSRRWSRRSHEELQRQGVDLRLGNAVTAFEPGRRETITVVAQQRPTIHGRIGDSGGGRAARHETCPRGGPGDRPDRRHPRRRPDAHQRSGTFSRSATRSRSATSSPAGRR